MPCVRGMVLQDRNVEARLRELAPDADLHFERIAVTPEQITACSLPTRPTQAD
jgi:hypothetical protein